MHCPPGCPHVHFSSLKQIARSPAHYRWVHLKGKDQTPAMHVGNIVHNLLLEDGNRIVVYEGTRRGRDWEAFKAAQHPDTLIATSPEIEEAQVMVSTVRANPHAVELLHGLREEQMDWQIAGRDCRGTCDAVNGVLTDLKTTADAQPEHFFYTARRMGYFAQLPWYMDGHEAAGLGKLERGFIVAIENKPPYVVQTFELTPRALDLGRRTYRLWFERLRVCEESNEWPGYLEGDYPLDMPEDLALFDEEEADEPGLVIPVTPRPLWPGFGGKEKSMDEKPTIALKAAMDAVKNAKEEALNRLAEIEKEAAEIREALGMTKPRRPRKQRADAGKPREKKALGKGLKANEASA